MLNRFYYHLRQHGLKPAIGEYLSLLEALKAGLGDYTVEQFHALARLTLVKDESQYDRFDRAFGSYFHGASSVAEALGQAVPEEWLKLQAQLNLSDEDKARLQALDWDILMQTLKDRLAEQQNRHQGGNRWIGTGGTSPFGNGGYNPAGVRIGGQSGQRQAVKVWEQRNFRNLDDNVELGTRNIKLALRMLRRFARTGAADELDLDGTITSTARNAGWLDIRMRPERHNAIKVLIFFDIGGSMDDHIRVCEELFSAAKGEFKHFQHFYLHNCLYERVWKDNARRSRETTATWEILHKYPADYRVIIVGDAAMSPYEVTQPGGSVEHWNEEAGAAWLKRLTDVYHRFAWLNPVPEERWEYTQSTQIIRSLIGPDRMYPLTLAGLSKAMQALAH